jgi:hypothetical protein
MTHLSINIIFVLNVLWFGMAFRYFSLTPDTAAKVLVPKSARGSPLFATVAASVRFLGGMNFAFALFALLLLFNRALFPQLNQIAFFAVIFAVAHASQFVFNLPVLMAGERQGESLWHVRSGPMLFIFVVDFVLMVANAVLAAALYLA